MLYAWGGFFAAHSSQLGMFEAAALLPWLLWASRLERRSWLWTGIFAGLILLAGNFDAAMYCFLALACFCLHPGNLGNGQSRWLRLRPYRILPGRGG